jgi:hypothetical protein
MPVSKRNVLTEQQGLVIEYIILNRFRKPSNSSIGKELDLKPQTIAAWRRQELFQEELDRRTALYKTNYDDVQLADRKERVLALQKLFDRLEDDGTTNIKLKILQEIRQETGGNAPIQVEMHHSLGHGPELPPRADTYEEWCEQNRKMLAVETEFVEMEHEHGKEKDRDLLRKGILPSAEA